jgi:4-alpha-glucanotransferase
MEMKRVSGILLHPTSFPGPHGIGDFGREAYRFVDFLADGKQSLWQILPLGPTGVGDSPYASTSSFAGNPLLISLDTLVEAGDLTSADLADAPQFHPDKIEFSRVIAWKMPLLQQAARTFLAQAATQRKAAYETFCVEHADWLDDFALYMSIKEEFDRQAIQEKVAAANWNRYWPEDLRLRRPKALQQWQQDHAEAVAVHKVIQFYFYQQWYALRSYATQQGIKIIGDIPIFVAEDSVDVWAHREMFLLDHQGRPTAVAGIPPDYFSQTGQRWGNPLYNWDRLKQTGFQWWIQRLKATLRLVDVVRIDHFRAFDTYWEIPASSPTAVNGRWVKAPGHEFFDALRRELKHVPIVVEDLGMIPDDVRRLRDHFHLPGMVVLQFAFSSLGGGLDSTNPYLPHNHKAHAIIYTGTHDNDTTLGWYRKLPEWDRNAINDYFMREHAHLRDTDMVWTLLQLAWSSVCNWAIIPMQDLLRLDSDARMNTPGTIFGNWGWRYRAEAINDWTTSVLEHSATRFGRYRS